jgi:predicted TIM-barrel fold metal-dependent hydrolase
VVIDVWMQHPTLRFLGNDIFESLRRWTGQEVPDAQLPIDATVAAMDDAGVNFGLLSAWSAPHQPPLISNEEVADWVSAQPSRFAGLAAVDLNRPMDGVRELRRCVTELGFRGLRVVPWLGGSANRPALLPAVRRLRGARRPVLHAGRAHRPTSFLRDG